MKLGGLLEADNDKHNHALANAKHHIEEQRKRFEEHFGKDLLKCLEYAEKGKIEPKATADRLMGELQKWLRSFEHLYQEGYFAAGKHEGHTQAFRKMHRDGWLPPSDLK